MMFKVNQDKQEFADSMFKMIMQLAPQIAAASQDRPSEKDILKEALRMSLCFAYELMDVGSAIKATDMFARVMNKGDTEDALLRLFTTYSGERKGDTDA
jgi:hypothetical protein